jgi:serine/threonine protein kinase
MEADQDPRDRELARRAREEVQSTGVQRSRQDPTAEAAGDGIDRYTLIEEIGEGGMGTVWRALQSEPVRREVALKVIKLGMDTREVVGRFEAERQALALMDHPHIAKVLDGGATRGGRPFFVMELVDGVPITDYCDREKLGARGTTGRRSREYL